MRYRKLDSQGDHTFGGSKLDYFTETEAVAQAIKTKLLLLEGEWWEDLELGFPLFTEVLGQTGTKDALEAIQLLVTEKMFEVEHVMAVEEYVGTLDRQTRQYSATCIVETEYGQLQLEVNL